MEYPKIEYIIFYLFYMIISLQDLQEYLIWNRGKLASFLVDEILGLPNSLQTQAWECSWQLRLTLNDSLNRRYECWLDAVPITIDQRLLNYWTANARRVLVQFS